MTTTPWLNLSGAVSTKAAIRLTSWAIGDYRQSNYGAGGARVHDRSDLSVVTEGHPPGLVQAVLLGKSMPSLTLFVLEAGKTKPILVMQMSRVRPISYSNVGKSGAATVSMTYESVSYTYSP